MNTYALVVQLILVTLGCALLVHTTRTVHRQAKDAHAVAQTAAEWRAASALYLLASRRYWLSFALCVASVSMFVIGMWVLP